ncbi:MAG: carbohydrate ABC transporter permease [Ruminococcaceae bacterium]|nr:carbohydrate ABC transporter permease [Oscillospiraceae bacterium]HHV31633.1 carbohydrate ABC transporter permease [Clostridiales bacterium]
MNGENVIRRHTTVKNSVIFGILTVFSLIFVAPILIVFMNSFKDKLHISDTPFTFPTPETYVRLDNYITGIVNIGFINAFGWSLFITLSSVAVILLCTSMTAWYITRVKNKFNSLLYYILVFSMVVPFQMVMFTLSKFANILHLDNPLGIIVIYLGFGAGMSTFLFCGFIRSIPIEIEEAAMIDGCNAIQLYFRVIFAMLKPITITVAILNAMWIWNDYLLPYLLIGSDYKTIPIAIQYLQGGYGSIDMGAMMAMLVLAVIPIIVFYAICQKYIIEGVVAGAVKG